MSGRCTLGWMTLLTLLVPCLSNAQEAAPPGYFQSAVPSADMGGYPCPPGTPGGYGGKNYYEEIPNDTGWLYRESPLEKFLVDVFRHSYWKAEYLLMDISNPGNNTLSQPNALAAPDAQMYDPNGEFLIVDPNTGNVLLGMIPNTNSMQVNENNGIRGTVGLDLKDGAFEFSAWKLQSSTELYNGNPFINQANPNFEQVIFQSVLQEGAATGYPLIYDISYQARLKTSAWGSEANWFWADPNPNDNIVFSPLVGVKYFNFKESLRQAGDYTYIDQLSGSTQIVQRTIDSVTDNYFYGPQIGFRTELTSKWFDLGATPRFLLGLNSYRANVSTTHILTPDEADFYTQKTKTSFGPMFELQAYTRAKLSQNFSILVSYNFMWAGMLTRPTDNIVYNTSITPQQGLFGQDVNMTDVILQGISIGGELRY